MGLLDSTAAPDDDQEVGEFSQGELVELLERDDEEEQIVIDHWIVLYTGITISVLLMSGPVPMSTALPRNRHAQLWKK